MKHATLVIIFIQLLLVVALITSQCHAIKEYNITTLDIGGGVGDGDLAVNAILYNPSDIIFDQFGNIIVADSKNNRIRKIFINNGTIITLAGNGKKGFYGENVLGSESSLNNPLSIAFDSTYTNLYISDSSNNRVRKLDMNTNIITTYVGTGICDGRFPSGDDGPAEKAQICNPYGIDYSSQGLLVCDFSHQRIRKVDPNSGIITSTVAPDYPLDIAVDTTSNDIYFSNTKVKRLVDGTTIDADSNGYISYHNNALYFISDGSNCYIKKYSILTKNVTQLAKIKLNGFAGDGGPLEGAKFAGPRTVIATSDESLAISDYGNNRIRMSNSSSGIVNTIAGTGKFFYGEGIPADKAGIKAFKVIKDLDGNFIISDRDNCRIRKVDKNTNIITTIAGNGQCGYSADDQLGTLVKIGTPSGIGIDSKGNIIFADSNYIIRKIDYESGYISTIAGTPTKSGTTGDKGNATQATLTNPSTIFIDENDNIYISGYQTSIRIVYSENGTIDTLLHDSSYVTGIVYSKREEAIYFAIYSDIKKLSLQDSTVSNFVSLRDNVGDLIIDNDGNLFASMGARVAKILTDGTFYTIAGSGDTNWVDNGLATLSGIENAQGLYLDSSNGHIYVTDYDRRNVRELIPLPECWGVSSRSLLTCSGRGSCIENNHCICNDGYFGFNCGNTTCFGIPSYQSSVCFGNGNCSDIDTCSCYSGWQGNANCTAYSCDDSQNCHGNGLCIGSNTCSCNDGWTGVNENGIIDCSIPTCYAVNNCSDRGVCSSNNTCTCQSGWSGSPDCSIPSCDGLQDCTNGNGLCISNNTCQCWNAWIGIDCSIPTCELVSNCTGRGKCIANNTCSCNSGWKGNANCTAYSCDASQNCHGNGLCISNNTCSCNSGWKGLDCSIPTCEKVNNCSRHGSCISNNTCQCDSGWKGSLNCSLFTCDGVQDCNTHGSCIANNTCKCESGWIGSLNCLVPSCEKVNNCSHHGSCISNNTCSCSSGWKGSMDCSAFTCDGQNSCNSHGSCISNNTCSCVSGWKGSSDCANYSCDGQNACNNHGSCISNNTCTCESGWRGSLDCNTFTCDGIQECNHHGSCTCSSNNTCACLSGWKGSLDCSVFTCDGAQNCNSRGSCIGNNTCSCESGWQGSSDCSAFTCDGLQDCNGRGSCSANNTCSCMSGWKGSLDCSSFTCDGVQNCNGKGSCSSNNTCSCISGWRGSLDCNTFTCDGVQDCNNHGSCTANNTCTCSSGWKGSLDCSVFTCDALNSCSNSGTCLSNNTCLCNSGWRGSSDCSAYSCDGKNSCNSHGSCILNNTCQCESGWKGNSDCSAFTCDGLQDCNGRGSCSLNNTCSCMSGWQGSLDCSSFTCDGVQNCNSRGSCIGNNTCSCESGWKGNSDCSVFTCDGLQDCNGRGSCSANNTCSCMSGWKGSLDCSSFTCDGVQNCNSRGSCSSNNTCQCESGWKGSLDCSVFTCDGLQNCNGRGSCIGNNTCQCESGWQGSSDCSVFTCDGLQDCNHHGSCISNNTCQCDSGWRGNSNCTSFTCDEESTCNSHSACISNNTCTCLANYYTSDCSVYCKKDETCSTNGICESSNGTCSCFSNETLGFWMGSSCSQCQFNYFGEVCKTKFLPQETIFSNDHLEIFMQLKAPLSYISNNVSCSNLLDSTSLSKIGSDSTCYWINKESGQFKIQLGKSKTISYNTILRVNTNIFNTIQLTPNYVNSIVMPPLNPILPVAVISNSVSLFSVCEEITIDGSQSYNMDQNAFYEWKWNCLSIVGEVSLPCDEKVMNQLLEFSISKSRQFLLNNVNSNAIILTLSISNTSSEALEITFPKQDEEEVVPYIELLSQYPIKSLYNYDDILSLSFLISVNGKYDNVNSLIERNWTLNGQPIASSSSLSNNIDLILSDLVEDGSTNTLTLKVTTISSKKSVSKSVSFSMSIRPPPCSCSVSPSSSSAPGYALDTMFSITCPNCKSNSQSLVFGFIDTLTNIKVPLISDSNSFSVPLPYVKSNSLTLYTTVTNLKTQSSRTNLFTQLITLPPAISNVEVRKKNIKWNLIYQNLPNGDPKKIVYGYITTTIDAMYNVVKNLGGDSRRNINYIRSTACPDGFKLNDCSMKLSDWIDLTEIKFNTSKTIIDAYLDRNSAQIITLDILTLQTLALDRVFRKSDEINEELFEYGWKFYKKQLKESLYNSNLQVTTEVCNALSVTLSNIIQARESIDGELSSDMKSEIVSVSNDLMTLCTISGNMRIGSELSMGNDLFSSTITKLYPLDLSNRLFAINNSTFESVKYPNMASQYFEKLRQAVYHRITMKKLSPSEVYYQYFANSTSNITITGAPYIVSSQITNQVLNIPSNLKLFSYIFHFKSQNVLQNSNQIAQTSEIMCISDAQCDITILGNDFYNCLCATASNVTIGEKLTTTSIISSSKVSNNDGYIALGVILGVLLIFIIMIVLIVIIRKLTKGEEKESNELANTNVEMQHI